jgi:hypothetical protein
VRRFREKKAMQKAKEKFRDDIERFIVLQFLFDKQWKTVKERCARTENKPPHHDVCQAAGCNQLGKALQQSEMSKVPHW